MNTCEARTAYAQMSEPSMTWCGSRSIKIRSLYVPGSLSSPLTTTQRGYVPAGSSPHLVPAGNPAPPRPWRTAALTVSCTASGVWVSAWRRPVYAPVATARESVCASS
jgi:hypothetical protein